MSIGHPSTSILDRLHWWDVSDRRHRNPARARHDATVATPSTLWALRVVALIAASISTYLAWVTFTSGQVAGCGSGMFDCSHVMTTKWSKIAGIPVSVPATALHVGIFSLLLVPRSRVSLNSIRWSLVTFLALAAGMAAIWFVGLQVFWVQHYCPYCLAVHTCGLVAAALVLTQRPTHLTRPFAGALVATAGLVGIQSLTPPPESFQVIEHNVPQSAPAVFGEPTIEDSNPSIEIFEAPLTQQRSTPRSPPGATDSADLSIVMLSLLRPSLMMTGQVQAAAAEPASSESPSSNAAKRKMATLLGNVQLNVKDWPLVGSTSADHVFVEMLDYTCPHCRASHAAVEGTLERYGDRVGVIILPVPLSSACNPTVKTTHASHTEACDIARLAIAVWLEKPEEFRDFHHWLMTTPPQYQAAYRRASTIVGEEALKKTMTGKLPDSYIAKNVQLYQRAGGGAIPKLLFPRSSTVGEITSVNRLSSIVSEQFGI